MTFSKPRLIAALVTVAVLSACSGDDVGADVRNGPQAVHPSPSALAATGLSYE